MKCLFIRNILLLIALLVASSTAGCSRSDRASRQDGQRVPIIIVNEHKPVLEATPIKQGDDSWLIATSETVKFSITAPQAQEVELLYRPLSGSDGHFILKKISEPVNLNNGVFETELKLPPDFSGDVWAEVTYSGGETKESAPISLTTELSESAQAAQSPTQIPDSNQRKATTPDEESARSDQVTGGKIERATLIKGQPALAISVNVPAFLLTLWQDGKEIKTYDVGVGRKNFPIVIGERQVTEIIFNPDWIPPDSEWVRKSAGVEPYERIEADDPRNPLGSLKIPLGDAYLIHQAAKPSDIGNLVSHGCIRMRKEDLFDLAEKIISARSLHLSKQEIEKLKKSRERQVLKLNLPLSVDINYDPQVVEESMLHIYPDIYDRQTYGVETLRIELQQWGVSASQLGDQILKSMLERATPKAEFVVSISDIEAGRALLIGENRPLTEEPTSSKSKDPKKRTEGTK